MQPKAQRPTRRRPWTRCWRCSLTPTTPCSSSSRAWIVGCGPAASATTASVWSVTPGRTGSRGNAPHSARGVTIAAVLATTVAGSRGALRTHTAPGTPRVGECCRVGGHEVSAATGTASAARWERACEAPARRFPPKTRPAWTLAMGHRVCVAKGRLCLHGLVCARGGLTRFAHAQHVGGCLRLGLRTASAHGHVYPRAACPAPTKKSAQRSHQHRVCFASGEVRPGEPPATGHCLAFGAEIILGSRTRTRTLFHETAARTSDSWTCIPQLRRSSANDRCSLSSRRAARHAHLNVRNLVDVEVALVRCFTSASLWRKTLAEFQAWVRKLLGACSVHQNCTPGDHFSSQKRSKK